MFDDDVRIRRTQRVEKNVTGRVRAHVWVTGLVQGVFFRGNTAAQARALDLDGWVKNLPDGRVEAVFEGDADAVESAVAWVKIGPPRAVVEHVDVAFEPPADEYGFSVR